MRRIALAGLGLLCLVLPAAAQATPTVQTFTYGPVDVNGYSVRQEVTSDAPRPQGSGFITHMSADVVDVNTGQPVPIDRIMLHHILFTNTAPPTPPGSTGAGGSLGAFYGDGEERAQLDLPPGYGYHVDADDRWGMVWMLMNHRALPDSVMIRYQVTWDDDPSLTPVTPFGFDASHLRQGLVYDVPGGGLPGSTDARTMQRPAPFDGRIVGGLGHVHGGAKNLVLTEPDCGNRTIYDSQPTWGLPSHPFYHVKPVLHEPGPIDMSRFTSVKGIPVTKGQQLLMTSNYDAQQPHVRVMGLMLIYIARDPTVTDGCGPLPDDIQPIRTSTPGRPDPVPFTVPLTGLDASGHAISIDHPPGATYAAPGDATVQVGDVFFSRPNLRVHRGATVTWAFNGSVPHDVTLANGPLGFSSNDLKDGKTFALRLTRPGTYRLFCALHPVEMTEVITVR